MRKAFFTAERLGGTAGQLFKKRTVCQTIIFFKKNGGRNVKIKVSGAVLTAYLDGEIDHHSAPSVRNTVDEAVLMHSPKKLVLDFSGVTFMDSSAIGLIMGRCKLMNGRNGTLEVCGLKKRDKRIVEMSGLKKLVEIR